MQLTPEQVEEVREAVKLWKSYLNGLQMNIILTPERKEKLATLVALGDLVVSNASPVIDDGRV
jgi:hypothetical protein